MAQITNQLTGTVSQKTLLGLLPFVPNPLEEMEELTREREENFDEEHDDVDGNNPADDE